MTGIDPNAHPADLIDQAYSMLHFLNSMIAASNSQLELSVRDQDGLGHITIYIEAHLQQALTKL